MSLIVFGSTKGAPGTTTTVTALGTAWPSDRRAVVLEADAHGGVLAARLGLACEPGLTTLAAAARHEGAFERLDDHVQRASGGLELVVAPTSAEQVRTALASVPLLPGALAGADTDVIVDAGRLGSTAAASPLLRGAHAVVIVSRPRIDELPHAIESIRTLRGDLENVPIILLLVGDRPYSRREVAEVVPDAEVWSVADDPSGVETLWRDRGCAARRSPLARSAHVLAGRLSELLGVDDAVTVGVES